MMVPEVFDSALNCDCLDTNNELVGISLLSFWCNGDFADSQDRRYGEREEKINREKEEGEGGEIER
jgi:hypothetical protein